MNLVVTGGTVSSGSAGGASNTGVTCQSVPLASANDPSIPNPGLAGGTTTSGQVIPPYTPGTWYFTECFDANGYLVGPPGVTFAAKGQQVNPAQLALIAESHLSLSDPAVQINPPADDQHSQFVNLPTWAWLAPGTWKPVQASVGIGGVVVTATAVPTQLVWSYDTGFGASASTTCDGPGTPYDHVPPVTRPSPDCGWTWRNSSAASPDENFGVSAHLLYHVTWTVTGAAGGGDLGLLASPDAAFRVRVGEIQALEIPPGG